MNVFIPLQQQSECHFSN